MRYKRNDGEFEIHRIPLMKGQAPSVEDMTEFVDICFDCADKGKRVVVFCTRGDDRTATMVAAWIIVSSMSLNPKYIAPEVAICHAENLRTDVNNRRVLMSEAQIQAVALFADRSRKRMRIPSTREESERTQDNLLREIISKTSVTISGDVDDQDEDVDELKRRVQDLESRNQELIKIVTREPMSSNINTEEKKTESNQEKKTESNHVKKVSSVETALSPALSRALRSFENAAQYEYYQEEEEEEQELSSISPLPLPPPSTSPTYVVLIVYPSNGHSLTSLHTR